MESMKVSIAFYGLIHGVREEESSHETHLRIVFDTDQSEDTVESNGKTWQD